MCRTCCRCEACLEILVGEVSFAGWRHLAELGLPATNSHHVYPDGKRQTSTLGMGHCPSHADLLAPFLICISQVCLFQVLSVLIKEAFSCPHWGELLTFSPHLQWGQRDLSGDLLELQVTGQERHRPARGPQGCEAVIHSTGHGWHFQVLFLKH